MYSSLVLIIINGNVKAGPIYEGFHEGQDEEGHADAPRRARVNKAETNHYGHLIPMV